MRSKKYVTILLFITVIFLNSLAMGQSIQSPELFIKEKSYKADEVMEGTIVEHTYTVFNKGEGVLEIKKVKPG